MRDSSPRTSSPSAPQGHDASSTRWRRLFRRWFIQYNPLYLCSAMLVLGGAILISSEVARLHITGGHFVVAAIAEVYAWALIGGAALLMRIGLRRPAVMLALLVAMYMGDLTLHAETSVYLGAAGVVSLVWWLASFVLKLHAIARVMHLRLARSTVAIATFGALGLAAIPRFFHELDAQGLTTLVTVWLFALFASRLWSAATVTSVDELDPWGRTVLRRATRGVWAMWAALALAHVLFWSLEYDVSLVGLGPAAVLLALRWARRERLVWLGAGAALALAGLAAPELLSLTCAMAAAVFALRALRCPAVEARSRSSHGRASPYRSSIPEPPPQDAAAPVATVSFSRADRPALVRLLSGTVCCAYLSAWTLGWSGGAWPEHVLVLDLSLVALAALMAWRARARLVIAPAAITCFHLLVERHVIVAPASSLGWGALSVAVGFALLAAVIAVSWWLRRVGSDDDEAATSVDG